MKKLTTLLLAAGMIFAAAAPASAVDVKFDGEFAFEFGRFTNKYDGNYDDKARDAARQRLRLGMSFVASENLSGYVQLQDGSHEWGAADGAFNTVEGTKFGVRQMYIDWVIPQTDVKVRIGKQLTGLPVGANGKSYIMHAGGGPVTAVTVNAPVMDNLGLTGFWARLGRTGDTMLTDQSNKTDAFGLYANYKLNGFSIAPYVMYASLGEGGYNEGNQQMEVRTDVDSQAYWIGFTATVSAFDPFTFKLGAAYGTQQYDGNKYTDRYGFVVDALATYKLGFGTVKAMGWYGSGDDKDDLKYAGGMPALYSRFAGSTVAFNGSGMAIDNFGSDWVNPQGTWGIQLGLTKMSFIKDLSHDFLVTYFAGTNHSGNAAAKETNGFTRNTQYLTTEDTAVEVAFNSKYKVYKNLSTYLELGYVFTDFADRGTTKYEDDWKIGLGFQYKF